MPANWTAHTQRLEVPPALRLSEQQVESSRLEEKRRTRQDRSGSSSLRSQEQRKHEQRFLNQTATRTEKTMNSRLFASRRRSSRRGSERWRPESSVVVVFLACISAALVAVNCQTCQYSHQSTQTLNGDPQPLSTGGQLNLIVCPKSSQYNDLPHFSSSAKSPSLERQQKLILRHLNQSFAHHLGHSDGASQADPIGSLLMDDRLLNEIISPLVLDAAYARAKEQIVKRRKLESELIRQGECIRPASRLLSLRCQLIPSISARIPTGFVTDMSKPTAVARHQRVTTTTTKGNELEKAQEIFEEMSRILAKK